MPDHNVIRRETERLIRLGYIKPRTKCDLCRGPYPEVNHLDYEDPTKLNYLCQPHHQLYHNAIGDPYFVPYAVPEWIRRAYRKCFRFKSWMLYYVLLRVWYLHRWIIPYRPKPQPKLKIRKENPIWDTVASLQAEKAKKPE